MSAATVEPVQNEPAIWTLSEVARFLRVNDATVRVWMKTGKLPDAKRLGQKWLFDAAKIKAMVGM
jgi:excisionase family DNA binding protein